MRGHVPHGSWQSCSQGWSQSSIRGHGLRHLQCEPEWHLSELCAVSEVGLGLARRTRRGRNAAQHQPTEQIVGATHELVLAGLHAAAVRRDLLNLTGLGDAVDRLGVAVAADLDEASDGLTGISVLRAARTSRRTSLTSSLVII